MNRTIVFLIYVILCNKLPAQGISNSFSGSASFGEVNIPWVVSENEIVYTPFGPTKKSKVHYVGKNHHLEIKNENIELVNTKTGKTERIFYGNPGEQDLNFSIKSEKYLISSESKSKDGWITYAYCSIHDMYVKPTFFSTDWLVPNPPPNKSDQIIYIFNGLAGSNNNMAWILQPVLQWGETPAGGGKYWAICNWFVSSKGLYYFYDTLIKVSPGDKLQGVIRLISGSDTSYSYNSVFSGYPPGLTVKNAPLLGIPYFALETYGVKSCDGYPADEKIRMFNIQIMIDSVYPPLYCYTLTEVNNCGQFTNVINESSKNGEVNIHFRRPYTRDGFDKIHVYPNPVSDFVHFSITDPIIYCRIEVYNSFGFLLHTEKHESLEWGYDLNLRHYKPGIYFIKFYFQMNTVTRQESHVFKIIKV